jgi:hypothetical protein
VNINVYDEGIAEQMHLMFLETPGRSEEITHRGVLAPRWARIKESIADLLKPHVPLW